MATTAGAGIALLVCGALIAAISIRGIDHMPLIGAVRPWQAALVIIGLVGLPVALLAFLLPKVPRVSVAMSDHSSYADALRFMRARGPVLIPLLVYSIAQSMLMATMGSWIPALIGRNFGLAPQTLGPILGTLLILCGLIGLWLVGMLIDRFNARGRHGAAIVGLGAALLFTVAGTIMPHIRSLNIFWPVEVFVLLGTTPFLVVTAEIVSRETPAHMVGKMMAVFLFAQAVIGYSFAPTLTALLSEHLFLGSTNPLGDAISTVVAVLGTIEIGMIALAWRNMRRGDAPSSHLDVKGNNNGS
jgi:MFS family permease